MAEAPKMPDTKVTCASCGMAFWVPGMWLDARRHDTRDFYCPNGHCLSFRGARSSLEQELSAARQALARHVDEAADLRRQVALAESAQADAERQRRAAVRAAADAKAAARAAAQRTDTRLAACLCPHCNRSFAALAPLSRHLRTKHPGLVAEALPAPAKEAAQ